MMSTFCSRLELDKENLSGKLILIVEDGNSNSNFALNSLLWKAATTSNLGIILLALHYPLHHYTHVGNKLGIKLIPLLESGRLIGLDPKKKIFDLLSQGDTQLAHTDVKALFFSISEVLRKLKENCSSVFIFIDDISDLLNVGASAENVNAFAHYLRTLLCPEVSLILGTHCSENDSEKISLKNRLLRCADISLTVAGLKTGISADVTGSIEVVKRCVNSFSPFLEKCLYHFKVTDRSIRIFSPGTLV